MKAKIFTRIIYIIVAGIFLFSAGKLIYHYGDSYLSEKEFDDLKTNNQYELKQLKKKNKDLVGRIKIKGTKIDYPVMQTPNNPQYYLRRNFEKKYSLSGTPFLDAASTLGKSKNYLIHAHNMKTDTMFNNLLKYEDIIFYKKHPVFFFNELRGKKEITGTYKIIAIFKSQIYPSKSKQFKYYNYPSITNPKKFNKYVNMCKALSLIDTGQTAQWGDQLVTLSTCAYHADEGRFVVIGKKIN